MVIAVLDEAGEAVMHFNSYFQHCLLNCGAIIAHGWMGSVAFRWIPSRGGLSIPFGLGECSYWVGTRYPIRVSWARES